MFFARVTTTVGTVAGSDSQRGAEELVDAGLTPPAVTAVLSGRSVDDPALRREVEAARTDILTIPGVASVDDPFADSAPLAPGHRAVLMNVKLGSGAEATADRVAGRLRQVAGVHVVVSGGPLTDGEFDRQASADTRRAETLAAPVLLLLLLLVFGSLLAAGLPLLIAVVGVGGTLAVLFAFSYLTDVSIYAIQVTTMLAIGLGVDYALLMVSRFREERRLTRDVALAVERGCESAGRTEGCSRR